MEFSLEAWFEQGAIIGKVGKWVELHWGAPTAIADESALSSPAMYQTTFFHETETPWQQYPYQKKLLWREWKQLVADALKKGEKTEDKNEVWEEPNKADFKKIFQEIKKEIKNKTVQKAVPVVTAQAVKIKSPSKSILQALKTSPVNTYVFGQWHLQEGFFGFSPEVLFLREKKNTIKTMALAGTRKKEKYLQDPEDFLKDPKELKEHQYVIDDISKRLQSLGKVKIGKTSFLELNFLTHLYTPLQVSCEVDTSFSKLLKILHPTPALGIVPREQMELLKKWRHKSETLGSPFGIRWSENEFLCLVAIRKIQWNKTHYFIGSGCGVVEESELEEEWQELRMKRDSVRKTFQL